MSSNLFIGARNAEPEGEEDYPKGWLLFKQRKDPIALRVERDPSNRPRVVDKSAALISWAAPPEKKKKLFGIVSPLTWHTC